MRGGLLDINILFVFTPEIDALFYISTDYKPYIFFQWFSLDKSVWAVLKFYIKFYDSVVFCS